MNEHNSDSAAPETVGTAIDYVSKRLQDADIYFGHGTDNPWDEAVQLVLSIAELPLDVDDGVLPHRLDEAARMQVETLLRRRIDEQIPLPYLLGKVWFAGLEFHADERAIIPRSPIAELILHQFQPWYRGPGPRRILDLCCGGGCIGLAAAHYFTDVTVDLLDIDPAALSLAQENAALLGVGERVRILRSNLFEALDNERYDLILSNPPYVNAADLAEMPREFHHEPPLALGSGVDGLALTHRILARAQFHLQPDGLLIVEVGNSWPALEEAYSTVPFTWIEFEQGGHGVFTLTARELQDYSACWRG